MPAILVIKPSSLGDIVHGLQVAESIRQQLPGARITWVAREIFAPLVEHSETVDEVLVFHRRKGLREFCRLLAGLHGRTFDWVLDFQGLARSALMAQAARCPRHCKLGRADAREGARWAYGQRAPLPPPPAPAGKLPPEARDAEGRQQTRFLPGGQHVHALDILLEFLPLLGCEKKLCGPLPFRSSTLPKGIAERLPGPPPILLFPSSRRPEKEWPGFSALAERLCAETPWPLIWMDSQELTAPPCPPGRLINLSGKTRLPELIPLMEAASLVVCNDSGPMHLAAALGRPVLALFGPTDPERFGPYPLSARQHHVLTAPDGDLRQLAVGRVAEVVRRILLGADGAGSTVSI